MTILSHRNPDGDAIGSALALAELLTIRGHDVSVVLPSEWPAVFAFLPGVKDIIIFDRKKDAALEAIRKAQLLMMLDFNALDRIDDMAPVVQESNAPKILIDHHLDPEDFADYELCEPDASSTAELVYVFLQLTGQMEYLNPQIADAIFTGIITDTGSFRFATTPRAFRICADLKELGANDYRLQNLIYNSLTEKQLRIIGHCLANRMELLHEYRTGIIHLTQQDFKDFGVSRGDTEGIVNYILMIRQTRIAVFITDQGSVVKLSFRSKGNITVQEFARQYFNGGGHRNASGGSSRKTLEEVIADVKAYLPEYLAQQNIHA